jgi:hypothetical protein
VDLTSEWGCRLGICTVTLSGLPGSGVNLAPLERLALTPPKAAAVAPVPSTGVATVLGVVQRDEIRHGVPEAP